MRTLYDEKYGNLFVIATCSTNYIVAGETKITVAKSNCKNMFSNDRTLFFFLGIG